MLEFILKTLYKQGMEYKLLFVISIVTHIQWAYGVTCWEIFSGGKVPYAELPVKEIPKLLGDGYRLERPSNCASNEQM